MGSRARSLGTILRAMLLSGLLAGGGLALFHGILTEPIIDQAIAFEATSTGMDIDPLPLVSRQQQKVGLVVGSLLYGIFVATIFGGVFYLSQETLPKRRVFTNVLLLAAAGYWLIALFPFLKYPANPPGVGHSATIEYRQALYVGFMMLSLAGGLLAANAARYIGHPGVVAVGYVAFAIGIYLLMPRNPDPIEVPMTIVTAFRVLSLVGLTMFWAVLGLSFGLLAEVLQPDHPRPDFQPRAA
jgi:predicted cobalt transporter CbtA